MWISGERGKVLTVTTIDGGYFVICQDKKTGKYRLVSLEYGTIIKDEFDSLEEVGRALESIDYILGRKSFV